MHEVVDRVRAACFHTFAMVDVHRDVSGGGEADRRGVYSTVQGMIAGQEVCVSVGVSEGMSESF